LAASTVNLKIYVWISTHDFPRQMLEISGRAIINIKTVLEEKGFNLTANITEVRLYQASNTIRIQSGNPIENK